MANILMLLCLFGINALAQCDPPKTGFTTAERLSTAVAMDIAGIFRFDSVFTAHPKVEAPKGNTPAFQKGRVKKTNKMSMTTVLKFIIIGVPVLAVLWIALFIGSRMNR